MEKGGKTDENAEGWKREVRERMRGTGNLREGENQREQMKKKGRARGEKRGCKGRVQREREGWREGMVEGGR